MVSFIFILVAYTPTEGHPVRPSFHLHSCIVCHDTGLPCLIHSFCIPPHRRFSRKRFYFVCVCFMHAGECRGQKRAPDPLRLELQVVVGCLAQVLGLLPERVFIIVGPSI